MTSLKVLVLGDTVGKTTLLNRESEKVFKSTYRNTIGVDIYSKNISGRELQLWVLSSMDHFVSVRSKFYSNTDAVILVCDSTNMNSLKSLVSWKAEYKKYCEIGIPVLLLINKKWRGNEFTDQDK